MKKIIVMLLLLTAVSYGQQEFSYEHTQSADKIDKVIIDCSSAKIYFEPSSSKEIKVDVKIMVYLDDEREVKEIIDDCKVKFDENRRELETYIDMPRHTRSGKGFIKKLFKGNFNNDIEVLVKATVPAGVEIEVQTSSADVYASNLTQNNIEINGSSSDIYLEEIKGDCYIDLSSGDLEAYNIMGSLELNGSSSNFEIEQIKGNVRISTSSGDGTMENAEGNINLKTSSGDMQVYNIIGNLDTRSTSGDIVVENISGSVRASSTSGTISLRHLSNAKGKYIAESTSGDIYLEIVRGFGGAMEIETTSGDISTRFDDFTLDRHNRRYVSGKVGKGDGVIEIETSSGDVTVEYYQ